LTAEDDRPRSAYCRTTFQNASPISDSDDERENSVTQKGTSKGRQRKLDPKFVSSPIHSPNRSFITRTVRTTSVPLKNGIGKVSARSLRRALRSVCDDDDDQIFSSNDNAISTSIAGNLSCKSDSDIEITQPHLNDQSSQPIIINDDNCSNRNFSPPNNAEDDPLSLENLLALPKPKRRRQLHPSERQANELIKMVRKDVSADKRRKILLAEPVHLEDVEVDHLIEMQALVASEISTSEVSFAELPLHFVGFSQKIPHSLKFDEMISVKKNMKFSIIREMIINKLSNIKIKNVKLIFDGELLNDNLTPNNFDMEEGDQIDVKFD